ncbi:hypothetical protein [Kitasatospora viridis]|uniref:Uncharacterized protein n=1 Tax=Kitasatospora viridis TaxID=281105 RepID=A0A561UD31_9ACTN|nr:hypothetical protein [Kitasatospora viridis]TWF97284.1 hypothetical protein FHX73_111064 [Kitasatospora viridis]
MTRYEYDYEERTSEMTLRTYRIQPDGTRVELSARTVRNGEPYFRPITGEWPECRCTRCVRPA